MAGNGHEPIKDEPSDVAEDAPDAAAAMQQRQQQQPQRQATPSAADDEGAAGAAAAAAAGEGARVRWPYGVNQSGLVRISVCLDDQGRPQADGARQLAGLEGRGRACCAWHPHCTQDMTASL